MSRIPRIERYREKTLDLVSLVAALSTARVDEPSSLSELAQRQDAQLQDLLHDLAFNGRKLLELVAREDLQSIKATDRTSVFCAEERDADAAEDWPLKMMSLRQICGRIIHSDHLSIERAHVPTPDGNLAKGESAWAFRVSSDRDPEGTTIFVYLEFFLTEWMEFDQQLSRDLRWATVHEASHTATT